MGSHDIGKSEKGHLWGNRSGHHLGGHHSCLAFLFLFASRIVFKTRCLASPCFSLCVFVSHGKILRL